MFGHDHKDEDENKDNTVQPIGTQPVSHGLLGIDDDDNSSSSQTSDAPFATPSPAPVPDDTVDDTTVPTTPSFGSRPLDAPQVEEITAVSTPDAPSTDTPAPVENDDDLLDIKREALEELSPLIDHLEQDSDEKFRTTMMMIQASDNKTLVPQAFAAARAITDDKKRAQALLDIVNEINYFTQKHAE